MQDDFPEDNCEDQPEQGTAVMGVANALGLCYLVLLALVVVCLAL